VSRRASGQVIGASFDGEGGAQPFLWQDGVMSNLNDLVIGGAPLHLLFAMAINSRGEISGFGVTENGDLHAFLAGPVSGGGRESRAPAVRKLSEDARRLVRQQLPIRGWSVGPR
jgi:probable HAF family extracellular repeat protein